MISAAGSALIWLTANPQAASAEKLAVLKTIPAWQWAVPGGLWPDLARHCSNRVEPPLERRPGNALNIEIGSPLPRCLYRPPDGRGITRNGGTLDWLRSGGSVLFYGLCEQCACTHATDPA